MSMEFELKYDLRNPPRWRRPWPDLYGRFLDQVEWADRHGFDRVHLHEHHFSEDGYLPSPLLAAAAIAGRTSRIRISLNLIVLPLKHPVEVAEQIALLDCLSDGRLDVVLGAGYRRAEYEAYGIPMRQRPGRMDEAIEILKRCLEEDEPFDFEGRYWRLRGVRVMPKPVQRPRPRLVLGGSSAAGALRAARLGDGFTTPYPKLLEVWRQEMVRLGKDPGLAATVTGSSPGLPGSFLHLARDPKTAWRVIGPHAVWESNSYAEWARERGNSPFRPVTHPDQLLESGYGVLTPSQLVARGRELEAERPGPHRVLFHPLMGGMPYELGQECLELAVSEVMPAFRPSAAPAGQ
jgi:alkanesulfonate monooxygenase SsuD/methylene tetrahydromethanopterin reductase-like flavin-dependent oxidoreductase (luciferase family)